MIVKYEKNAKVGKVEQSFLKTARKKTKEKENLKDYEDMSLNALVASTDH
jgi:hypothetical protein